MRPAGACGNFPQARQPSPNFLTLHPGNFIDGYNMSCKGQEILLQPRIRFLEDDINVYKLTFELSIKLFQLWYGMVQPKRRNGHESQ